MVKRVAALMLGLLVACSAAAFDVSSLSIKVGDIERHKDALAGFFPTLLEAGVSYTGITLLPENRTSIDVLIGGAYMSRDYWKDSAGEETIADEQYASVWSARWEVLFNQGFLRSDWTGKDMVTLSGGVSGRWEGFADTGGVDYFFDGALPDVDGIVSNALVAGMLIDMVAFDGIIPKGASLGVRYQYSPLFLSFIGESDYQLLTGTLTGYLPLYSMNQADGKNLFSVYLANRIQADMFFGFDEHVPIFAQDEPSLGSKMRGLERLSRAGSLTVVNNFDIRLVGPELYMDRLYPRLHVFADFGYFNGVLANGAAEEQSEMFGSVGAEAGLSLFDFLNLGYRGSYMVLGENMLKETFVHGVYLSLQFK